MDKTSLTFQALKNSGYNLIGYIWPLVFTLFITPIILFKLGIKEYGIYLFVSAVISLIGLIDLGLGMAVSKHMSFYFGKKDESSMRRLTHSANSLFVIIGLVGFFIAAFITWGGQFIFAERFSAYHEYAILFLIGGGTYFMNTIGSTYNAILFAIQRFDITTKIGIIHITLSSLSMLAVVMLGGSLPEIFFTQFMLATALMIYSVWIARKLVPVATLEFGWNREEIVHCYKFGLAASVNSVATVALTSLDRLIIPFYAGAANLTYYSMPGNVTAKIPGIANTLSTGIFPTVSQFSGDDDIERIKTLYMRSFRLIIIIAGALTITCISFSYDILLYWLDRDFAESSWMILVVLALTNFILALFGPLSNFLLGLGKLKSITYSSLAMAGINAAFLLLLLPRFGILGAAWAYLISVLPVAYLFYYVERNYLMLRERKKHYARAFCGLVLTSFIMICLNLLLGIFIVDLLTLLVVGGTSTLLYVILYRFLGFFEEEDWRDMEKFFSFAHRKLRGKENN